VIIDAQPELVFRIMISCTEAMKFVPHLLSCLVVDAAPDGGWQIIEQEVDYSWLLPRMRYAFRARYEAGRRVQFSNVSGDFREHEGIWHLQPMDDGNRTLLTYAVKAVPRFFVPQWLIRRSLRKELPELLRRLRTQCESVRSARPALERPEP
jgi:ribosome-associated toxin RatA of RatAB toxin-antitoxin module